MPTVEQVAKTLNEQHTAEKNTLNHALAMLTSRVAVLEAELAKRKKPADKSLDERLDAVLTEIDMLALLARDEGHPKAGLLRGLARRGLE
jgi:hypothetical protein